MKQLDKIKKIFKKGKKRKDAPVSSKNSACEDNYNFYESFVIYQNQQKVLVKTHFRPNETRQKEINNFVKQGIDGKFDIYLTIYNVQLAYNIGVGHWRIPEENTLLLFFG